MLINYFKISATLLEWGFLINWRNLPLLSPAALQGKAMAVRRARAAQPFRGGATADQDVAELYTSKHQCLFPGCFFREMSFKHWFDLQPVHCQAQCPAPSPGAQVPSCGCPANRSWRGLWSCSTGDRIFSRACVTGQGVMVLN